MFYSLVKYFLKHEHNLDLQIATLFDVKRQKQILNDKSSVESTNISSLYLANSIKNQILGNTGIMITNYNLLLSIAQTTNITLFCYKVKEKETEKLISLQTDYKFLNTTMTLAKLLLDYPLYITDTLCVRLRLYPNEHWISRTSGVLKHLLCDYTSKKITLKGIINLLQAYYACDEHLTQQFNLFLSNYTLYEIKKTMLFEFFHSNYISFINVKHALYFMLLHMHLLKVEKTNLTDINVEIDQTASGIVFLSLLLRDKKMAKAANLINKEKNCPYTFVMKHFKQFAETHITCKTQSAIDFLSTDRKLHKYALMCFIYSQKHIGRMDDFYNRWLTEKNTFPTPMERKTLQEFALKYELFIETIFPNTIKKLQLLKEAVELVATESNSTSINTLEGEVISWSFFYKKSIVRNKFDPITRTSSSYKTYMFDGTNKIDIKAHKHKFLSYLIHSIDAAVIRYFIRNFAEKYNYKINHLHDCILLHPNYVDNFYDLVTELYKSENLYYMSENLVFDPMKPFLSVDSRYKLDKIKKEFLSLCDNFKDEMDFDPRNLYRYES